ncbi:MAG: glycosyltransferase family 39 protein, partial [Anaerolineales bacterium]|nr:glycosyltransferase family 39 protein [Anaerolineales bacterium]
MNETPANRSWHLWLYDIILVVVLLAGMYLRLIGLNWDSNQHLHPDERFLTMVESALQPMKCAQPALPVEACPEEQKRWLSLSDYFNTKTSTLNPHNRGYAFFVYGTLPIFIVRYAAEWLGQIGYDQVDLVGRQLSTIADLGTILLLYFIVSRLYGRKIGLLAATFSTFAVLQIQQSHFFTVDTFANFFMFLAIYFVVRMGEEVQKWR